MSYIITSTNPFVSIKLTEKGREQLSLGQLNFSFWAIGDSELNYDREAIVDANPTDVTLSATSKVLRPVDQQPNIKSFITSSISTSNFQAIDASNLNVIKATVNNEALERGFFTNNITGFTTNLSTILTPYYEPVPNTNLSGGTTLTLSGSPVVSVGDIILLKLTNTIVGPISVDETTIATPNLWFKVQGLTGSTLSLDRTLPNLSADTEASQLIVYRGGEIYESISTGTTTSYWDTGTLSFNSSINITCHDVPVWNMNNVWCEDLAGITGQTYEGHTYFGSYPYLGTKNPYFEYLCVSTGLTDTQIKCNEPGISYLDDVSKSISIIHYTNNAISNLYGEFFYVDATSNKYVKLHIPNIMYHRSGFSTASGTSMGVDFIASGSTNFIGNSDIEYIELIESTSLTASTSPLVVGKVFPQLKMIVIDNDEIVAALSYKSNRNWTLPELSAVIQAPSGGTSTGVLAQNQTMYLTYLLEVNGVSGLTTSLPCQKYVKIDNITTQPKDVAFRINGTDLLPFMRKIEDPNYDGLGFYATNFKLLYQVVSGSTERPDPAAWNLYDFTTSAITVNTGETIDPKLLENQIPTTNGFILDSLKASSATTFNLAPILNMPQANQPDYLQFGDERFFYGNLETYIGATIYKTIFDIRVNSSQFDLTSNPTRSSDPTTNPPNIKVSEVGIYDNSQNLVCIGKLSKPVALLPGNTIMLELSLDF
jgi:hypothetical protein